MRGGVTGSFYFLAFLLLQNTNGQQLLSTQNSDVKEEFVEDEPLNNTETISNTASYDLEDRTSTKNEKSEVHDNISVENEGYFNSLRNPSNKEDETFEDENLRKAHYNGDALEDKAVFSYATANKDFAEAWAIDTGPDPYGSLYPGLNSQANGYAQAFSSAGSDPYSGHFPSMSPSGSNFGLGSGLSSAEAFAQAGSNGWNPYGPSHASASAQAQAQANADRWKPFTSGLTHPDSSYASAFAQGQANAGDWNPYGLGNLDDLSYAAATAQAHAEANAGWNPYGGGFNPGIGFGSGESFGTSMALYSPENVRPISSLEIILPTSITGQPDIKCSYAGEMFSVLTLDQQCLICACSVLLSTLTPVCVGCDSCARGLPIPGPEPLPVPIPVPPIPPPEPQVSCSPLPDDTPFQNPLNPCQICICSHVFDAIGQLDVQIECQENPQCGAPADIVPIPPIPVPPAPVPMPLCENFPPGVPFPHPYETCQICECLVEAPFGVPEPRIICIPDLECEIPPYPYPEPIEPWPYPDIPPPLPDILPPMPDFPPLMPDFPPPMPDFPPPMPDILPPMPDFPPTMPDFPPPMPDILPPMPDFPPNMPDFPSPMPDFPPAIPEPWLIPEPAPSLPEPWMIPEPIPIPEWPLPEPVPPMPEPWPSPEPIFPEPWQPVPEWPLEPIPQFQEPWEPIQPTPDFIPQMPEHIPLPQPFPPSPEYWPPIEPLPEPIPQPIEAFPMPQPFEPFEPYPMPEPFPSVPPWPAPPEPWQIEPEYPLPEPEPLPWPPLIPELPPSPLPGPPPHRSCRPYPPNLPFQHPWDECKVCVCSEFHEPGVNNIEVNCYTKPSCCVELPFPEPEPEPFFPPIEPYPIPQPIQYYEPHPEPFIPSLPPIPEPLPSYQYLDQSCEYQDIGSEFISPLDVCKVCSCELFGFFVAPMCRRSSRPECAVSPAPAPYHNVVYIEPTCRYRLPNQPFAADCSVCSCQPVFNYVIARCSPTPNCDKPLNPSFGSFSTAEASANAQANAYGIGSSSAFAQAQADTQSLDSSAESLAIADSIAHLNPSQISLYPGLAHTGNQYPFGVVFPGTSISSAESSATAQTGLMNISPSSNSYPYYGEANALAHAESQASGSPYSHNSYPYYGEANALAHAESQATGSPYSHNSYPYYGEANALAHAESQASGSAYSHNSYPYYGEANAMAQAESQASGSAYSQGLANAGSSPYASPGYKETLSPQTSSMYPGVYGMYYPGLQGLGQAQAQSSAIAASQLYPSLYQYPTTQVTGLYQPGLNGWDSNVLGQLGGGASAQSLAKVSSISGRPLIRSGPGMCKYNGDKYHHNCQACYCFLDTNGSLYTLCLGNPCG